LTYDDFEGEDWGSCQSDSRNDARLRDDLGQIFEGTWAARIRDDGKMTHTAYQDVSAYTRAQVRFWFMADLDDGDSWILQYQPSSSPRSQWFTTKEWVQANEETAIDKSSVYFEAVDIDVTSFSGIKLRFLCNGGRNSDDVYVDEIQFVAK
jgi:hypothetical protein